jgi:DNA-binding NarL/FixJ family response regulator
MEVLAERSGPARKVFLDLEHDPRMSGQARSVNADAYVPWTTPTQAIQSVIRGVLNGTRYFESDGHPRTAGMREAPPSGGLTPRQLEVLHLLERGATNKDIAEALGMAAATVKIHVNAIFKTLGVRNRTEAAIHFHADRTHCEACGRPTTGPSGRYGPESRADRAA